MELLFLEYNSKWSVLLLHYDLTYSVTHLAIRYNHFVTIDYFPINIYK